MELMKRARNGRRKIGNNFYLYKSDDGNTLEFVHHNTIIVKMTRHNIKLHNGGYYSVTTKKNLNKIIKPHGFCVFQKQHEWYVDSHSGTVEYYNGMELFKD